MNAPARLRQLLREERLVVAPGVYDGISARLVEQAGFKVAYMTGYGAVASSLGVPDLGLATMTEMVERAARIAETVSLPVIADADTGYGNALNVKRTVRAYERAGLAGLHLEDQVAPKRCGHMAGKQVVPLDEMRGKLRAAADARQNPDFLLIARTDAIAVEGFESAVTRANAYLEDMAFVEAPETLQQLRQVPRLVQGPCLFNAVLSGKALAPTADLAESGYRLVIFPVTTLYAAAAAIRAALAELRAHGDLTRLQTPTLGFAEFNELIGAPAMQADSAQYG
jgi:2-methylisocitrate lyase-like PEP mutase family enzyme